MKKGVILVASAFIFLFLHESLPEELEQRDKPVSSRSISLLDVVNIALENSLDVQMAKLDAYIKRTSLLKAESVFDIFLTAGAEYTKDKRKRPYSFLSSETLGSKYSAGLRKRFVTGTDINLSVSDERTDSNSAFDLLNPRHNAEAGVSLSHPLLGRNFFGVSDRARVKITKIDIKNAEYASLSGMETALYNVQKAYWEFVLKSRELEIKKDMLKEARRLEEIYREKYEIGLAEEGDYLGVQANAVVRENDLAAAGLARETAKNNLLFLLNEDDMSIDLIPSDSLSLRPSGADLYKSVCSAIKNRRDYKELKNLLKALNIDITVKKNALWPEVDLTASYVRNGLDIKQREAWNGVADENNFAVSAGVKVSMPVENKKARGNLEEKRLEKKRLLLALKRKEAEILKDINNGVRKVNTLKGEVIMYGRLISLQKKKLDAEFKRLRYGRSNSDLIIRYEDDLLNAKLLLSESLYAYRVSLAALELAENSLLDKYWDGEL